jgi:hypothetical protein
MIFIVIMKHLNNSSTPPAAAIINNNVGGAVGATRLRIGPNDGYVLALDTELPAISADARASSSGDTLDEAIGGILEPPPVSLARRHVARPDGDEGAYGDGRAGAHVDALGHGRAVIVKQQVARRRERRRRQRRRHAADQQEDGSGSLEHLAMGQAGSRPPLWGRLWGRFGGLPSFHPKGKPLRNKAIRIGFGGRFGGLPSFPLKRLGGRASGPA